MNYRITKIILLLCLYGSVSNANLPLVDTTLILKNVNYLDVVTGKFVLQPSLVVKNGKIIKIGSMGKISGPVNELDIKGAYLLPGLIDVHVHVTAIRKNRIEVTLEQLTYFLKHGITSVRDAGGDGGALLEAKRSISEGKRAGPDIYFSSFMAGDWYYNRGIGIRTAPYNAWEQRIVPGDDLNKAMAWAKSCGATGVKLYHSFDREFLSDVVKAAKRNHLKVWGHMMLYPATPVETVNAGMETLSHISMLKYLRKPDSLFESQHASETYKDSVIANMDIDKFCKQMKKHKAILDPTICVSIDRNPWILKLLERVHRQGVKIAAGTDQIVDLNSSYPRLIDELNYFVANAGFTNAEAIRSATLIAEEVIGQEKNIGSIAIGKKADLIVIEQNPLKDIKALTKINLVIKNGKVMN